MELRVGQVWEYNGDGMHLRITQTRLTPCVNHQVADHVHFKAVSNYHAPEIWNASANLRSGNRWKLIEDAPAAELDMRAMLKRPDASAEKAIESFQQSWLDARRVPHPFGWSEEKAIAVAARAAVEPYKFNGAVMEVDSAAGKLKCVSCTACKAVFWDDGKVPCPGCTPTSLMDLTRGLGTKSYNRVPQGYITQADARGGIARETVPDAVAGCRLGCACKVHRPAKPEPYVPAIDDWDLLPDAGR